MAELVGGALAIVVCDDDRTHHEAATHKLLAEAEHVFVVSDAEVGSHFVLLYVFSTDDNDDFQLVAQLSEHAQFAVWLEAGKHARSMMVVE